MQEDCIWQDVKRMHGFGNNAELINDSIKQAGGLFSLIGSSYDIYKTIKKQRETDEERACDSLCRIILYAFNYVLLEVK